MPLTVAAHHRRQAVPNARHEGHQESDRSMRRTGRQDIETGRPVSGASRWRDVRRSGHGASAARSRAAPAAGSGTARRGGAGAASGEEGPVGGGEPHLLPMQLSFEDCDLVAQGQDFVVLGQVTHGDQSQHATALVTVKYASRSSITRHPRRSATSETASLDNSIGSPAVTRADVIVGTLCRAKTCSTGLELAFLYQGHGRTQRRCRTN